MFIQSIKKYNGIQLQNHMRSSFSPSNHVSVLISVLLFYDDENLIIFESMIFCICYLQVPLQHNFH